MIQRVQSVYLLLAAVSIVVFLCFPTGYFIDSEGIITGIFKPLGVTLSDNTFLSTWGLFALSLLSALIQVCTIFLFRNRMLQMRMSILSIIVICGYYIAFIFFLSVLKEKLFDTSLQIRWPLCLPLVSIILTWLANRAIHHDENLVKAADRLR